MHRQQDFLCLVIVAAAAAATSALGQTVAPLAGPAALKTPWGEPDLQGIWKDEFDTPLQRSAKYAGQEFFTEAQRAELDKERATLGERRRARGDDDVTVGLSLNLTGAGTWQ